MLLHSRRRLGDINGARGCGLNGSPTQIVRCGKSPGAISNHADADAGRLGVRSATNFAVLGRERAAAIVGNAGVGVGSSALCGDVQGPGRNIFHGEVLNLPRRHRDHEKGKSSAMVPLLASTWILRWEPSLSRRLRFLRTTILPR